MQWWWWWRRWKWRGCRWWWWWWRWRLWWWWRWLLPPLCFWVWGRVADKAAVLPWEEEETQRKQPWIAESSCSVMWCSYRNKCRISPLGFLEERKDGPLLLAKMDTGMIYMGVERSLVRKRGSNTGWNSTSARAGVTWSLGLWGPAGVGKIVWPLLPSVR